MSAMAKITTASLNPEERVCSARLPGATVATRHYREGQALLCSELEGRPLARWRKYRCSPCKTEGEAGTGRGRRIQWDGEKVSDSAAAAVRASGPSASCLEYSFLVFLAPQSRWAKLRR